MAINFFFSDITFRLRNKKKLKIWIKNTIEEKDCILKEISIFFCSDSEILQINRKFLNHNYFTDIITFPFTIGKDISADIYISIPTVKKNAKEFKQSFNNELNRVIIHGILHLLGFDDKNEEQKLVMSNNEDRCLCSLSNLLNEKSL